MNKASGKNTEAISLAKRRNYEEAKKIAAHGDNPGQTLRWCAFAAVLNRDYEEAKKWLPKAVIQMKQ